MARYFCTAKVTVRNAIPDDRVIFNLMISNDQMTLAAYQMYVITWF